MQLSSLRKAAVTLGAVAALAVGTGILPGGIGQAPAAQAAELGQPEAHHRGQFPSHARYWSPVGFHHRYWGWGFHRYYPAYYTVYEYEPVNVCTTSYYFDSGVWYCFTAY